MTSLNKIPEDPAGFRIEPDADGWRWTRIADGATEGGFNTREEAIAATREQPGE